MLVRVAAAVLMLGAVVVACADDAVVPAPSSSTDAGSTSSNPDGASALPDTGAPDGAQTSDGGTGEAAYCAAVASHGTCPGNTPGPCGDSGKCLYGKLMSPAGQAVYNACFSSPSCKSDDKCVTEAGLSVGGAAASAYTTDCLAKQATCGFQKDSCSPAAFAYAGFGEAAAACILKPCGEVVACFTTAYAPLEVCKN